MQNDAYEKAFDEFLERQVYEEAHEAIFALVRAAFLAGWRARESGAPAEIIPLYDEKKLRRDNPEPFQAVELPNVGEGLAPPVRE